jgi:hypothetical protein
VTQLEERSDALYRYVETPWEPSFWERGLVRYGVMSYSLWARNIYWELRITRSGVKRPKPGRPIDPRLTWVERHWTWLWGR